MSVDQAAMAALEVVRSLRRNDGAVARVGREGEGPRAVFAVLGRPNPTLARANGLPVCPATFGARLSVKGRESVYVHGARG